MAIHGAGDGKRQVLEVPVVRRRQHKQAAWPKYLVDPVHKGAWVVQVFDELDTCAGIERLVYEPESKIFISRGLLKTQPGNGASSVIYTSCRRIESSPRKARGGDVSG